MNDQTKKENIGLSSPTGGQGAAWVSFIHDLQDKICFALEELDGKAKFIEDKWERPEGGGGKTRVIANGNVFEKGGVNTSVVFGDVTDDMRKQLKINGDRWWACGLSLVLHPVNPFVPTVHCNYRMFELYKNKNTLKSEAIDQWFGGGTDLTPYYLFEEDAKHFHRTYKDVCDEFDPTFYPAFKKNCDDYFVNTHRGNERRGIGGIFYDHMREAHPDLPGGGLSNTQPTLYEDANHFANTSNSEVGARMAFPPGRSGWAAFAKACGNAFLLSYIPIVEKRKNTPYTKKNKHWQEIRRGRYVEFNLIHDRGTLFGLKTNGRTESVLMSLPPTVRFEYNYQPKPNSKEDKLLQVCLQPRDWV